MTASDPVLQEYLERQKATLQLFNVPSGVIPALKGEVYGTTDKLLCGKSLLVVSLTLLPFPGGPW